jgi:hypothetical protein
VNRVNKTRQFPVLELSAGSTSDWILQIMKHAETPASITGRGLISLLNVSQAIDEKGTWQE